MKKLITVVFEWLALSSILYFAVVGVLETIKPGCIIPTRVEYKTKEVYIYERGPIPGAYI